jgi:glucose-1-phosphate adenylyltransferase
MAERNTSPNLIILAAGVSSRMKRSAATHGGAAHADAAERPKSLIRLGAGDRPFMDYVLSNARDAGYEDIVLVVGEDDGLMRSYYGPKDRNNPFHGLRISYATQRIPEGRTKPLGTADAVLCGALSRIDWQGTAFTVCNSDNIYSIEAMSTLRTSPHPNALIAYDTRGLRFTREQEYNNALLEKDEDGFLTGIVEKPGETLFERHRAEQGMAEVSMNIFRFDYGMIVPCLQATPVHPVRNEKELPSTLMLLLAEHPRSVYCLSRNEYVPDLTSGKDIPAMTEFIRGHFGEGPFGGKEA